MAALLELRGVWREYGAGDGGVAALRDVDLRIDSGELVAIIGPSGSGKSTLMNVLGCLDRPTRGSYAVAGQETAALPPDDLARLRREHFGFIFQRYHLLGDLDALGNVEIPSVYGGAARADRRRRAAALLDRLGMADRAHHRPGQLSGGQQQRVSIARALMNGGPVILADEPTGALDRASGEEVMAILRELNADGHTVILVTHDARVAAHARRIVEISDGRVVSDRPNPAPLGPPPARGAAPAAALPAGGSRWAGHWGRLSEATHMAVRALATHRLRTLLTMLGIIIGIASVVSMVALGEGSRQRILTELSGMGTNTIDVFPGKDFGDRRAGAIETLRVADADALARLSYVDSVTPGVSTSVTLRRGNVAVTGTVNGVGEQFFRVRGYTLAQGRGLDREGVRRLAQEAVIDPNTRKALFPDGEDPVGQVILLGALPVRVVGVTAKRQSAFGNDQNLNAWVPYTTCMSRLLGQSTLRSLTVRVSDAAPTDAAEAGIVQTLTRRHGTKDFFVMNTDAIRQMFEKTTETMTLLLSAIALISLAVGGIGVMNIMLVSVTERTQEIGVRMAVGARQGDILRQFLVEALLVCLAGGVLGVLLALGMGVVFAQAGASFRMVYSGASIAGAFGCSSFVGILFGFWPARNAARLDPVEALSR
ncbi:MacB family efflux pump subunit [Anaeromyxobacter paludicola]|uniref:Pyoverdine export ATP-binding/permease protein PvdT n=1 Tax=Anaeromyxobacter paludicola TaxID=2918171 RepID=A0ABM7XDS3_9BACT|nr:MacB family efflux pump subunit [Anaeromyxobacter paludicola]BDG10019.1 macrolide export ATP-binding/permease protein MacB [Anaeromyxobacter paludicola]